MTTNYKFDNHIYETVAVNLKKYLQENNVSPKQVAELAQIKESYLLNFLNRQKDLSISIYDLYKISVILNVSIDYFFKNNN